MYEASYHPVWGSGFHLGQHAVCKQENLKLENGHGRILEKVRREIFQEDGQPEPDFDQPPPPPPLQAEEAEVQQGEG